MLPFTLFREVSISCFYKFWKSSCSYKYKITKVLHGKCSMKLTLQIETTFYTVIICDFIPFSLYKISKKQINTTLYITSICNFLSIFPIKKPEQADKQRHLHCFYLGLLSIFPINNLKNTDKYHHLHCTYLCSTVNLQ